jgi:hypothetical protein
MKKEALSKGGSVLRRPWVHMCFAIIAVLLYSPLVWRPQNYFEILGARPGISNVKVYEHFRKRVTEFPDQKEYYERHYKYLKGENRRVYMKLGDHIDKQGTIDPSFLQIVASSAVGSILLLSATAGLCFGLPGAVIQGGGVYLVAVFCADLYARFVEDSFLPRAFRLLPFEMLNFMKGLYPAIVCILIVVSELAGTRRKMTRMPRMLGKLLRSNTDMIRALNKEPALENDDDKTGANEEEFMDVGSLVHKFIGASVILLHLWAEVAGPAPATD